MQKIHKDMKISDILDMFPPAVEIFLDAGLNCTGCGKNTEETLLEGMIKHSFDENDADEMVQRVNDAMEQTEKDIESKKELKIQVEDLNVEKVSEGQKNYYKLAGMIFTQKAFDALHEMKEAPGFQIKVEAGGCSGFSYNYDYKEEPENDEAICKLSDDLNIYINDFSYAKLHNSTVDFSSGLKGSGLTFHNPNSKRSCHCGSSVGF